jgi:hypothetical protein
MLSKLFDYLLLLVLSTALELKRRKATPAPRYPSHSMNRICSLYQYEESNRDHKNNPMMKSTQEKKKKSRRKEGRFFCHRQL